MPADGSRPNFFVILGLDPRAPWDERAYKNALDKKKQEWSNQLFRGVKTHPATGEARDNLSLIPEIERVMRNKEDRKEEQDKAAAAAKDERHERAARAARRAAVLLARGYLHESEYEELKADLATADEAVRRHVESAEKRPDPRAHSDNERLAPETEQNIRDYLRIVEKGDLYEVLREVAPGVGSASPRTELRAAADEFYRKTRNIGDKNSKVSARERLAGIAKTVFETDANRRRYDISRRLALLDPVLEQYKQDLAVARRVDVGQFKLFLDNAVKIGIDVTLAKEAFIAYFRDLGWPVEGPGSSAEARLETLVCCPQCRELNDSAGKHCIACGSPLTDSCPRCSLELPVGGRACPQCGFRIGMRAYVEYLAEKAEELLAHGDAVVADDRLREATRLWALGQDSDESLAIRLRALEDRLGPVRDQQQEAIRRIDRLLESRTYRAAQRQLGELRFSTPAISEMLQRCENAIRESDRKVTQAREPGISSERKAALYLEALDYCADNHEASRKLLLLPPSPPTGLRVKQDEDQGFVRLSSVPAPDEGCSSVVIRADGPQPPVSPRGHRHHTVPAGGTWEDPDPLTGHLMWYAVYTQRKVNGTFSERPVVTTEPVLLTGPPGLAARPGNRQVELTWTVPENAAGVELRREEVADGTVVRLTPPAEGATCMVDRDVRNGARYRYAARAAFTCQMSGRPSSVRYSRETACEVEPTAVPPSPGILHVRRQTTVVSMSIQNVRLRWTPPVQGEVRVVRSLPGRDRPTPGKEFPEAELGQYGLVMREPVFSWQDDREHVCLFTPVLALNGRCHVGTPRPYAIGPEVGDARAEYLGTSVKVTWVWPDGVDEALVAWNDEHESDDPVSTSRQTRVRRAGDATTGRYEILADVRQQLFVQVAAVVRDNSGTEYFTSGVGATAHRQVVYLTYEVQHRRGRRARLILRPDQPAYVPALVLRGRADDRPAGRTDSGIARIPAGHVEPGAVISIRLDPTIQPRSCRLFTENEADADLVSLVDPS